MNKDIIGIIGSGTMGSGIAQVAARAGHSVLLYDNDPLQLEYAQINIAKSYDKLVDKGKFSRKDADDILELIDYTGDLNRFANCGLVIEAIVENHKIKSEVFERLCTIVDENCIIGTNTSSLSIASLSSSVKNSGRLIGIHFFNPAPILPLVEVVPWIGTEDKISEKTYNLIKDWGKVPVMAKDTPGFIVNRVARSFYGESLRIYEEGIADFAQIDKALKEKGGFRMGPFELMDLIGNDVNFTVTSTVFKEMFYDPRYKPSITQKRLVEAGMLGRKTGRGYYDYSNKNEAKAININEQTADSIFKRVIVMLINEAADALLFNIASREDLDLAMTKGVNYPKGLLKWADELGIGFVVEELNKLYDTYKEDRYRVSPVLEQMKKDNRKFYE